MCMRSFFSTFYSYNVICSQLFSFMLVIYYFYLTGHERSDNRSNERHVEIEIYIEVEAAWDWYPLKIFEGIENSSSWVCK